MRRYRIRNVRIASRSKRLERRRKKIRALFRNIFRLLLILIIVSFLGFLGKWFYEFLHTSQGFEVKEIDIQGLKRVKEKEILNLLSLELPQNIFVIDLKKAKKRIEIHPRIKEAIIHRRPPERIVIRVREREPMALINQKNSFLGIDSSCVPFPLIEPLKGIDLPFITGIESSGIIVGKESNATNLRMALDILKTILSLKGNLYSQVSEINMEDGIVLYTTEGATRVHMEKDNFRNQLLNLQGVLIHLNKEKRKAEYIDLKFKDKVIVKEHETTRTVK
jgi:cell division protein FtsQ